MSSEIPTSFIGGRKLADYAPVVVTGLAPAGVRTLGISIVKGPTTTGEDSFLFFADTTLVRGKRGAWSSGELLLLSPADTAALFCVDAEEVTVRRPIWPAFLIESPGHNVELVDRASGARLRRPDFSYKVLDSIAVEGFGLHGSTVTSRVAQAKLGLSRVELELWVDGGFAAAVTLSGPQAGDAIRIPLPSSRCDGRPHLFQLRHGGDCRLLGQFEDFGPDSLTPWDALQQYGGPDLPIGRAPAMEHRYRGVRDALRDLAERASSGQDAAQIGSELQSLTRAHELVVEGFGQRRRTFPRLSFPELSSPRVSVIIPVHDKIEVTYNCLAALLVAHNKASFEVIIVDDGSSDATLELAGLVDQVKVVRNPTSLGFVGACNRGAEAARGEFLVLLNNDTEPTAGWLDELIFVFESFGQVGLVGSKLTYPDGRLQEAGGIVWDTGDPWNYGRGGNSRDPRFCYTREVDYVSGAALMIRAELWSSLGGLSAEFAPAYFEDTDLAFKVRRSGLRVVFAPFSQVYHYEGLSNGVDPSTTSGLKRFQEINRPKFKRKWSHAYRQHSKLGSNPDLAKDRGVVRRVVMFDAETPRIDNDAGSYAAIQEIRLLQAHGFKVTFVPGNLAYLGRHTELLQRMGAEVIYAPFYASLEQFIAARSSEFDLAFVTRFQVAARVTDLLRRSAPTTPIICNIADLHFLRAMRQAALNLFSAETAANVEHLRDEEMAALRKVDLVLTYSVVEQGVIASHTNARLPSALLPWVVDASAPRPFAEREGLAFLGGFNHPPNISAVEYLATEVMPAVRQRLPGVKLRIYGSNIPKSLLELESDHLVFEGQVADVAEVFDRCRVFVAPLRFGAGVKGKVMDCVAAGVPAVLSSTAAEGISLRHGQHVFVANTTSQWVEAVSQLYLDEGLWNQMSKALQDLAEQDFSFESGRDRMTDILERVGIFTPEDVNGFWVKHTRPPVQGNSLSFRRPPPVGENTLMTRQPRDFERLSGQRLLMSRLRNRL